MAIYPFDDTLLNRTKCPVKLLELLAAGVPVVGDAVGQIAEVVVEGETGHLVRPGDEVAFVEAVLDLLADPTRLARMRLAARADVASRYVGIASPALPTRPINTPYGVAQPDVV